MDIEIVEQLKYISAQLEKIAKLLEEKKSFTPKSFGPKRESFGDKKPFSKSGPRDFDRKPRFGAPRFNADGKPRVMADGRNFGFKNKKRERF